MFFRGRYSFQTVKERSEGAGGSKRRGKVKKTCVKREKDLLIDEGERNQLGGRGDLRRHPA